MKKIPVWKNAILIVAVIVIIVIATLAWFYTGNDGSADDLDVHVGKATYIQVSGDSGNNWSDDLDMEIGINNQFKEISGDGSSFFTPNYDVVGDPIEGYSTQLVSFTTLSDNELYYEQILDLRGDAIQKVYLAPESCVSAVDNGYIDGAIRVAFFELDADGNETLKLIWAPNSTVQFSSNAFTREGSVEPYYYYQKSVNSVNPSDLLATNSDVAVISTQGTDEAGCGYNAQYKFMWSSSGNMPANAPVITTLDAMGDDELYYKKIKVRVWLEGHDRECVSLLNGQKFTMELQFVAQEEE